MHKSWQINVPNLHSHFPFSFSFFSNSFSFSYSIFPFSFYFLSCSLSLFSVNLSLSLQTLPHVSLLFLSSASLLSLPQQINHTHTHIARRNPRRNPWWTLSPSISLFSLISLSYLSLILGALGVSRDGRRREVGWWSSSGFDAQVRYVCVVFMLLLLRCCGCCCCWGWVLWTLAKEEEKGDRNWSVGCVMWCIWSVFCVGLK